MHMSEWTVEVIRSAYALDRDQRPWLTQLANVLVKSIVGVETWLACGFESSLGGLRPTVFASAGSDLSLVNPLLDICTSASVGLRQIFAGHERGVGSVRSRGLLQFAEVQRYMQEGAWDDCFYLFATCADHTGCAFFFPCSYQPRTGQSKRWQRVLPHIAAGWQLRRPRAFLARAEARHAADNEALTATADAVSPGPVHGARSWHQMAITSDREYGRPIPRAPVEDLWRRVFDGHLARLLHFVADGRRYVVLRTLSKGQGGPLALTNRERRIVELATNVEYPDLRGIARVMECKESTAATHLARAMKKLGVRSRAELIALMVGGVRD